MRELQNYFREVQKALPCGSCEKKKILRDLRLSVDNFLEENPGATFAAVESHFGTPAQIADTYTEEMAPRELQRKLKIKKWIIGIIAGAVACALLIWGIAVGLALVNEFKAADGYGTYESLVTTEE